MKPVVNIENARNSVNHWIDSYIELFELAQKTEQELENSNKLIADADAEIQRLNNQIANLKIENAHLKAELDNRPVTLTDHVRSLVCKTLEWAGF